MNIIVFLVATFAQAIDTRPANQDLMAWLTQMGPVSVTNGGTMLLPQNVLSSQLKGQLSPIMQFAMQSHLMNKCTEKAIALAPGRRTPYVAATAQFNAGLCVLFKCFQQEILMMVLPQLKLGGTQSNGIITQMISAFSQGNSCDNSGDKGIDPLLLTLLTQSK